MAKPTPLFYVFYGSDQLTIAETLGSLKRRLGSPDAIALNTSVLSGRTLTLGELRHACDTVPFLADKRLIIVEGMLTYLSPQRQQPLSRSQEELLSGLLDYLPKLPETARLVFVEGQNQSANEPVLSANHPVIKLASGHGRGYVRVYNVPAEPNLPGWIEKRARDHRGAIEPAAARELANRLINNPRYLDRRRVSAITGELNQEIIKLLLYTNGERPISVEDVEALSSYVHPAIMFDLTDALGTRDGRKATRALHSLLDMDKHPLELLGSIAGHFRMLIQVKELKSSGASVRDIASTLKVHNFRAEKLYNQATYYTAAQLEGVYRHLLEMDVAIKTSEITGETALDLLVAGLAAPED